jgi:hypothetical protein
MVGLPFCFFLPAKSLFFFGAFSLKKLPMSYFVAFMPFMFSSLSSMEEKKHLGKGLNPIPLVEGEDSNHYIIFCLLEILCKKDN